MQQFQVPLLETSAKTGMNVTQVFNTAFWLVASRQVAPTIDKAVHEKKNCNVM